MNIEFARQQMIGQQVRSWDVIDEQTLDVMARVKREAFAPPDWRISAFVDTPIPIGHGQYMDAPKLDGRILQAMGISPGERAYEIGTGSGYLSACMAAFGAHVLSVERIEPLAAFARDNIERQNIAQVTIEHQDASEQLPKQRFDVIVAGGSVAGSIAALEQLLTVGGRLFVVQGAGPAMTAMRVERMAEERWYRESLFETMTAPLHGFGPLPEFQF